MNSPSATLGGNSHIIDIMQGKYSEGEKWFCYGLAFLSVTAYIPLIYALHQVHKNRGFEIVTAFAIIITQIIYKGTTIFSLDIFLNEDGWHKMLNIALLVQFL